MPFNPSAIVKNRKKWFSFKSRSGSPTTSHFNDEGIPTTSADVSIEETEFAPSGDVQIEETSTDIFSLPPELLAEIFLCSLENWRATVFDHRYAPVNITQTCHLWREVAIRAPQLWNVLRPKHSTPLDMVQLWISRVGNYPLVVDLKYLDGKSRNLNTIMQNRVGSIIAALFNHSSSVVQFTWVESICHPIILSLDPSHFPRLQSVSWTCSEYAATDPVTLQSFEHFWSIAGSIPSLQSATLSHIPPIGPWNQLAELCLMLSPIHTALQALGQCVRLRKLYWSVCSTVTALSPIVIPNLQHLSLSFQDRRDSGLLLDYLTVPNIHHIMLRKGQYPAILKSLTHLLHRSNAQLQSFELYAVACDEQPSLLPFFRDPCLSTLRRFVMRKGQMLEEVWEAFSQASFLPSLEQLQLSVDRDLDIEAVGSYLRTRELQDSKLFRLVFLVVCYCDAESEEVWARGGIYNGCRKLHPPWDTLSKTLRLCTHTEVIPCGEEHIFRSREIG